MKKNLEHNFLVMKEKTKDQTVGTTLSAYWKLMKPELTGLSVFTSVVSAYLAISDGIFSLNYTFFLLLGLGTFLVGGGAGVLNQYIEQELDAMMKRTERRPLPSGKIFSLHALIFGVAISLGGIALLTFGINFLTGFLSALTLATYLFLYTPLKRLTSASTIVGAIPGALPVLIGWSAARNEITLSSLTIFAIVFYWQMPHFYALAWMYKSDYAAAQYKILSVVDTTGKLLGKQVLIHSIILLCVSILPAIVGIVSVWYLIGVLGVGIFFIRTVMLFYHSLQQPENVSQLYARKLFYASLYYIPIIFILMIITKL